MDIATDPAPSADEGIERPSCLADFNGQSAAKGNLAVFIGSARRMGAALDHVLFHGPPGVGKTTLARIIANELGVGFRTVSAPAVQKASDIVTVLAGLEPRDVVFLDEIHRLPAPAEEVLYSAMEDFRIDVLVGEGPQARAVSVPLEPFTLVGATTRLGSLSAPLKDRFGIPVRLELYSVDELKAVVSRACPMAGVTMDGEAVNEIARRSRGTPRIALRLLRRVRDFAVDAGTAHVDLADAVLALDRLGVDPEGLDEADRRYIAVLRDRFSGGPVGLKTLASALGESPDTVEHSLEPFLVSKGLVDRTQRGRVLCSPRGASAVQSSFAF